MIEIKNIFAIIDPATDNQLALERAKRIARVAKAKIHAYLCISPTLEAHDPEALQRVETARYTPWLENIVAQARAEGFDVSSELDWNKDWRHALASAAQRANSDLIVKSSHRRTAAKRLMMTSSDLALLETAKCSVQLVSGEVKGNIHKVLMAVDTKREDTKYQLIFDEVVNYGKTVAATTKNGELHAVYAYSGSENYQHVTDIAKRVGLDTSRVHVVGESPDAAIVEVAGEIEADMIIIGLSTSSTLANRIFGNMVDRLLNNIDHDILVVIPATH